MEATNKNAPASDLTKEFREFCQSLIREKVKSKADKQKLADFLGLHTGSIDSLLYQGIGSVDTFAGALFFLYDLDLKTLRMFLKDFKSRIRKTKAVRESDQGWYELDDLLTEEEKCYWVQLIRAAAHVDVTLAKKKKRSARKRS